MKHWVDKMFYTLNFLTAILFVLIALWPCIRFAYSTDDTPVKWNEYCALVVWYAYSTFCIVKLTRYLRRPNPEQDLNFLYYLIGLVPVYIVVFIFFMVGFSFPTVGN
jgi:hypothetical protein